MKRLIVSCVAACGCASAPATDTAARPTPIADREPPLVVTTQPDAAIDSAKVQSEVSPSATDGPDITAAAPVSSAPLIDCGFVPAADASVSSVRAARPDQAGCGLAFDPQAKIETINVIEVDMSGDPTVVRFVLLDAGNRRVVPARLSIWFDLVLVPRATGRRRLDVSRHRDGVFELEVKGRRKIGTPCNWWVRLRYEPVTGPKLVGEMDDWLHSC
jgi:hypothetical protein